MKEQEEKPLTASLEIITDKIKLTSPTSGT